MQAQARFTCPSCNKPVTTITTYLRSGRQAPVCECTGEIVDTKGKYSGCLARYMPPVELIPRNLPTGDQFASYLTDTGQTDLSGMLGFSEHADTLARSLPTAGYRVEVLDPDNEQEIRVAQAVRDFGLLVAKRDARYAASIGVGWTSFVSGIEEDEVDTLADEGAYLPVTIPPARAIRPTDRNGIRQWRKGRSRPACKLTVDSWT